MYFQFSLLTKIYQIVHNKLTMARGSFVCQNLKICSFKIINETGNIDCTTILNVYNFKTEIGCLTKLFD